MDRKTRTNLRSWIQRQGFIEEDDEKGPVTKVAIHQVSPAGKLGMEIGTLAMKYKPNSDDLSGLVDEAAMMVDADVEGIGQLTRYIFVAVHRGKSGDERGARLTVKAWGSQSEDEEGEVLTEGPTKSGHLAQMMRHTESFARIAVASAGQTIASLTRQLEESGRREASLMEKNFEVMELLQELTDRKHERNIATKESEVRIENRQEMFHKLMLIVPLLVNSFISRGGKKLLPEKMTGVEGMMYGLAQSLKTEQFMKLMEVLTPDQQAAFGSIYKEMQKFDSTKQLPESTGSEDKAANG